jgi:hypothetical protein
MFKMKNTAVNMVLRGRRVVGEGGGEVGPGVVTSQCTEHLWLGYCKKVNSKGHLTVLGLCTKVILEKKYILYILYVEKGLNSTLYLTIKGINIPYLILQAF